MKSEREGERERERKETEESKGWASTCEINGRGGRMIRTVM